MKRLNILTVLFMATIVCIILFMYPKQFKQSYKDVQVFENGNKISKIDVELDGRIYKGDFVWKRLKFSEELHGTIIIDGKEYSLHPIDLYEFPDEDGNYTDNGVYKCLLTSNPNDILNDTYLTFSITHDKSKLYISSDSKEFIYPYSTDEDYQKVKGII